jgi:phage-related protein
VEVLFYKSASGRHPAYDYLYGLPVADVEIILGDLELIKKYGIFKAPVVTRQLFGKLWEIKTGARHQQRFFYCVVSGPVLVILHACKKQKTGSQPRDVEIAFKRMKEVLS